MSAPARVDPLFLQFIEQLALPGELVQQCHELLNPPPDSTNGGAGERALEAVADVISQHVALAKSQHKETTGALLSVNGRLGGVVSSLERIAEVGRRSFEVGQEFNEMIQAEVTGMDLTLQEVDDLSSAKRAISIASQSIASHIEDKSANDQEQRAQFEQNLAAVGDTMARIENRITHQCQKATQTTTLEMRDPLTGCYNRMAYLDQAAKAFAAWRRSGTPLSLVFLGIDRLNQVNERFGHKAGDQVLQVIAKIARNAFEGSGTLFRNGGGEFVCLLGNASLSDSHRLAEQLRRQVAAFRFHSKGERIEISLSGGAAQLTTGEDMEGLFERAYDALLAARTGEGNRIER